MQLNRTGTPLTREERINVDENWQIIEQEYNNVVDTVSNKAYEQVVDSAKLTWQAPVDTYEDLATTYPNPEEGWTVMAMQDSADYPIDENDKRKAGTVWRYSGTDWEPIQRIDAGPVNEVDTRLNQKIDEGFDSVNQELEKTMNYMAQLAVNIKTFGADENISDNSTYIQNAIDYVFSRGGGIVWIPTGVFKVTNQSNLKSGVEVSGSVSSVLQKNNGGYVFQAIGEIGEELSLSEDITSGDTTINTVSSHGLTSGDIVLIKSQRSAFSDDASDLWRLGGPTGGTNAAYFGEFLLVNKVNSGTSFNSAAGVIYPDYFKDNTRETDINARESSTIQKLTPIKDAKLKGFSVRGDIAGVVNVRYGYNTNTENLDCYVEGEGSGIVFRESFNCHDYNSKLRYNPDFVPSDHYKRNAFKVISGQNCGFKGTHGEYGTQTFDFTFLDYSIVTTFPYFKDGYTSFSDMNPGTTHGGVYGAVITDNQFLNCRRYGLSVRARNSIVSDNTIQGSATDTYAYGVAIYEGWARDNIVSNNQISGFNKGVTHIDGTDSTKFFSWMGTRMHGNVIRDVNRAFLFELNNENRITVDTGISISDNSVMNFIGEFAKGVTLSGINGATVSYNSFKDESGVANAGVYLEGTGTNNSIINNDFIGISTHLRVANLEENISIRFESAKPYTSSNIKMPNSGVSLSEFVYGGINPRVDNSFALGWSGGRWSSVFAASGTINTSDERVKQQIDDIPDSWLDAWSNVQYKRYKFNDAVEEKGDDARWHIGMIAQQIDEAFKEQGLDAFDIGLLCYDKWLDEETGEEKDLWSIRPDECQFMEMALLRRKIEELETV
ncbi:cell wall surface anchor family protein [Oceanobacillus picturae]|uniref:Cell wall surface anchor family protein n=1 Tax=Oceanobacillus picturae TaxID=171693 RepID=A0A0U9HCV1_9BACI|nr:tail fiber domain-containing protein [Oceanobacillus picturae]GAQ18040.1 cell wall surface anchor family protein [Oceanobacillus picturae]